MPVPLWRLVPALWLCAWAVGFGLAAGAWSYLDLRTIVQAGARVP